jgi:hypothetical protein
VFVFYSYLQDNMNKIIFHLIVLCVFAQAYYIRTRCSKQINSKIFKELIKQRNPNNTVVLSRAFPIISNKTGFPEELVKKCLGFTS